MTKLNHFRAVLRLMDANRRRPNPDRNFRRSMRDGEACSVMDIMEFIDLEKEKYPLDEIERPLLHGYVNAIFLSMGERAKAEGAEARIECHTPVQMAKEIIFHEIKRHEAGKPITLLIAITDFNKLIFRRSTSVHDELNQPFKDAYAQLEAELML